MMILAAGLVWLGGFLMGYGLCRKRANEELDRYIRSLR